MTSLVLLIPYVQLGINWWITVSLGALIWMLVKVVKIHTLQNPLILSILLCTLAGMLMPIATTSQSGNHDLIRVLREGFILLLFTQIFNARLKREMDTQKSLLYALFISSAVEFIFSTLQYIGLKRGKFFSIPFFLYGDRGGVLPTSNDLIYSPIRPTGTFSEPSYLGLICVGLIICALTIQENEQLRKKIILLNSFTILFSQSKLGYLGLFVIITIHLFSTSKRRRANLITPVFLCGLGIFTILLIFRLGNQAEDSFSNRFGIPFQIIPSFLLENPFGYPFHLHSSLLIESNPNLKWESILHNSFYNLAFSYGLISVPILFLLYWYLRRDIYSVFFITLGMIQNGSFLDFDKLFIVSLVCIGRLNARKKVST